MNPRSVRLPLPLQAEADAYAESLGISFNALVAVALRDYLDARPSRSVREPVQPGRSEGATAGAIAGASAQAVASAVAIPRVGVNERCPCGSGLKYKRCHGRPGGAP